jgi:hypothetical protein
MSHPDVRWQQRFSNYRRALEQLEGFFEPSTLNEREQQGLIKVFEYTFELAWNTLRDLLRIMASVDDLLLPWQVDMALRHQLPDDLLGHINRVGRCIRRKA